MPKRNDDIGRAPPPIEGIFLHRASGQWIASIGYHEKTETDERGRQYERRIRTTHYLGRDPIHTPARYYQIKSEWQRVVAAERKRYEEQRAWKLANGLPPLGRFKPNWPKGCRAADCVRPWSETVQQVTEHLEREEKADPHKFTIREARERYVGQHRARIGLLNGKGINENTHTKFAQNLTLCLGLNKAYTRPRKPIDVDRCFDELTYDDYRDFVHFWCDPAVVNSGRTGINYLRAFKQMLDGLKIKLPEGGEELFALKVSNATRIVRYQPEMLKKLLNCEDERARLFQLMFLNLGYYAIDIARLRFDHVTDAEGHPYSGRGEMFITRRREKTSHQNDFTTTCYVWPETKVLMEKFRAPPHLADTYFLSQHGNPYSVKTVSGVVEKVIRDVGLARQFSVKQYRKVGASQIKALAGTDAMHQYKANAPSAAEKPYILEDFSLLTRALKRLRTKLRSDEVL